MLILHGDVYTKDFTFEKKNVRIRDGRILEVTDQELTPEDGEEVREAAGLKLIPGLTDIHFHGCMGADLCDGTQEALSTMARYERSVGVTNICPATMTLPLETVRQVCLMAAGHHKQEGEADLVGINLEGPFISPKKVGAQNPAYVVPADAEFLKKLLEETDHLPKLITVSPEDKQSLDCISGLHNEIRFSLGHTCATYEEAKAMFEAGARHMTHLYNAMPGLTHREPGPIAAGAEQEDVTPELICDCIHIHPAAVRAAFSLFGPERMILISDSTRACGMEDGRYELGGQPIVKRDGAAWLVTPEDPVGHTLAGSATNLFDCMKKAMSLCRIPEEDALRAATYNPAMAIGILEDYGTIEPGKKANLVLVTPEYEIREVF